jgi:protein-S-isoprenylcysteine O-methyltransferase Ste14
MENLEMKQIANNIARGLNFVFFSLVLLASMAVLFIPAARTEQMSAIQSAALTMVSAIIVYRAWRMGLATANHKAFFDRLRAGERVTGSFFERVTIVLAFIARIVLAFST